RIPPSPPGPLCPALGRAIQAAVGLLLHHACPPPAFEQPAVAGAIAEAETGGDRLEGERRVEFQRSGKSALGLVELSRHGQSRGEAAPPRRKARVLQDGLTEQGDGLDVAI